MTTLPAPSVPSGGMGGRSWDAMEDYYPKTGTPGLRYWRGVVNIGDILGATPGQTIGRVTYDVDNLLYRSRKGTLVGILQYFPTDAPMDLEAAGNFNVFVHPRRQRRGLGLKLVAAADLAWGPLNFEQQKYTPEGRALIEAYLKAVHFDR